MLQCRPGPHVSTEAASRARAGSLHQGSLVWVHQKVSRNEDGRPVGSERDEKKRVHIMAVR